MKFYDVKKMYLNQIEMEITAWEFALQHGVPFPEQEDLIRKRLDTLYLELIKKDR